MLFLPLEEDSLLFRLCLYYGALVLLLELLVPLLFQRRVRIEIPRLPLRAPAVPLSTREFQQRRLALRQQVAALQRDLAETPRQSPQKRRQISSASAAKQRLTASSPLASPTSSVKNTRPPSSRKTSESKRKNNRKQEQQEDRDGPAGSVRQMPMAMSDFLATSVSRRGGFSFDEIREKEIVEENREEKEDWTQVVNTRLVRRREPPTFSGRKPVRLVEDVDRVEYSGPSEAAARLETLIGARRRRRESTLPSYVPPPPPVTAKNNSSAPIPIPVVPAAGLEKPSEHNDSTTPESIQQEVSSPIGQQSEQKISDEDEETKESERNEHVTDFQAFCASFAAGGSAAAQAAAKRKHHEAFGSDAEQTNGGASIAQQSAEKRKHPRVLEQDSEQPEHSVPAALQILDKRSHYEAFGSDDEKEIDDAVAAQQALEKRSHDQAFGTTKEQERPQEKTPRIIRRISFGDEVDALATPSPKEVPSERSTGKRKHKQAFGMLDDEDEDTEWRDSLAFRPHRMD
ncbi:hypothetical protein PI124_g6475 [Phytophthora idaei]|nr:hypothetical protein PI125_g6164 [Phytophthora idaei]KAG3162460.1 hypothetical protein PI126_g5942 [Phytophthora idaei]KAG3248810.1 hypothetical protein PI124_g6475 [Phytophthora idaei]